MFAEKADPFINWYPVGEPSRCGGSGHSLVGQGADQEPVFYASEAVDYAAYAGIDASHDGDPVFDRPECADGCVLGKLGAWADLLTRESDKPAVVADIDQPVNLLLPVFIRRTCSGFIQGKSSGDCRDCVLIANNYAESIDSAFVARGS